MTKKQKSAEAEVKDLLNQVVILCEGTTTTEFLSNAHESVKELLKTEEPEDYYDSEDYNDSSCW